MKPAIIAGILGATLVSADPCYHDGSRLTTQVIKYHAQRACEGYDGKRGAFQGTFAVKEAKYACVSLENNQYLQMWVTNENTQFSFDLNDKDCTKEFNNLMNTCQSNGITQGGAVTVAGWRFRADPGSGGRC
ncbi:secreted protein [Colletotrichum higginsianum]|nr:secreted protein [Colletotrichum higginsianum]